MNLRDKLLGTQSLPVEAVINQLTRLGTNISWEQLDNNYWTIGELKWRVILKLFSWIGWRKWKPERYDCDDFAQAFSFWLKRATGLNSVGICEGDWNGTRHAWGIIVTTTGVLMVEPQTMKVVDVGYTADKVRI